MKTGFTYAVIIIVLFTLSTCRKYPDGGFVNQTRLHLFGGHKVGDSKTWKLKLYEVNGIDSTYLIPGAASISDFYEKVITFTYTGKNPSPEYKANTFLFEYKGELNKSAKQLTIVIGHKPLTIDDSLQCKVVDGIKYFGRNLLYPESNNYGKLWDIRKLTRHECILERKPSIM